MYQMQFPHCTQHFLHFLHKLFFHSISFILVLDLLILLPDIPTLLHTEVDAVIVGDDVETHRLHWSWSHFEHSTHLRNAALLHHLIQLLVVLIHCFLSSVGVFVQ